MSSVGTDDDGFTYVTKTSKRKGRQGLTAKNKNNPKKAVEQRECPAENTKEARDKFIRRVREELEEFLLCDYFANFLEILTNHLGPSRKLCEIFSFGLGKLFSCSVARNQLLLLLALQKQLSDQLEKISIFDPIFCELEIQILEDLNFAVPRDNTEGVLEISRESLLYFPHCPKQLTNNFLWSNWNLESLSKCFIVANSFDRLLSTLPNRVLEQEAGFIKRAARITRETPIDNCYRFSDIFNDLSFHSFVKLQEDDPEFWTKLDSKPQYSSCDIEYVQKIAEED